MSMRFLRYMKLLTDEKRTGIIILIAACLLILAAAVSCCLGSADIGLGTVVKYLFGIRDGIDSSSAIILGKVRFPRVIMACLIGGSLAGIGSVMQGLFKNPMADPSILGVSSGSAFGAALVIVLNLDFAFWGLSGNYIGALLGAAVTWALVYFISRMSGEYDLTSVLLAGLAISSVMSALITLLMTLHRESMEQVYMWMLGTFSNSTIPKTIVMGIVCAISIVLLVLLAPRIDILKLGTEVATTMGIKVKSTVGVIFGICSVLLAFCVANSGVIGFVGLIIPHCVGFMGVTKSRPKLILSFIVGALFTVVCDTIAKTIAAPSELAVGAVTSIIGAPYFLFLLMRSLYLKRREGGN